MMKTKKQLVQDAANLFLLRAFSLILTIIIVCSIAFIAHRQKSNIEKTVQYAVAGNEQIFIQSTSSEHQFFDVPKNHPNREAIDYGFQKKIIKGFNNETMFNPSGYVTRAELVKIIANTAFTPEELTTCTKKYSYRNLEFLLFPDVPKHSWFSSAVCVAKQLDIIKGYPDGFFRPHQRVSVVEAAKIFAKLFDIEQEKKKGDRWFDPALRGLEERRAIPKSISSLDDPITRGEFMEILYRLLEKKTDKPSKSINEISPPKPAPCSDCLVIEQLGIQVPIIYGAGDDSFRNQNWRRFEKDVLTALRDGVVHYPNTATPGMIGNVFISGHSSYYQSDPGKYKDVFAKLGELKSGDEYVIYRNGQRFVYKIDEERIISPNDFSVLSPPTNKELSTLMTCWPINTNKNRKIFVAERVM